MKNNVSPKVMNTLVKVINSCKGITGVEDIAAESAALFTLEHGKPAPREEIGYAIATAIRDANKAV